MAYPSHNSPTPLEQKGSQQKLHQKKGKLYHYAQFKIENDPETLAWCVPNLIHR